MKRPPIIESIRNFSEINSEIKVDLTDFEKKKNSPFSIYNPSYESDLSASISQPLLRNAGRCVNEHSIRIAEYNSQITDAQTKLEAI